MAIRHLFVGFLCTRGSLLHSRDFYNFPEAVILLRNFQHCGISSVQQSIPGIPELSRTLIPEILALSQSGIPSDSGIASSYTIISSLIHPSDHPISVLNSGTE